MEPGFNVEEEVVVAPAEDKTLGAGTGGTLFLSDSFSRFCNLALSLLNGTGGASSSSSSSSSERNGFRDFFCGLVSFSVSFSFPISVSLPACFCLTASAFILSELDLAELRGGGLAGRSGRNGFRGFFNEPDFPSDAFAMISELSALVSDFWALASSSGWSVSDFTGALSLTGKAVSGTGEGALDLRDLGGDGAGDGASVAPGVVVISFLVFHDEKKKGGQVKRERKKIFNQFVLFPSVIQIRKFSQ